jgi:replicative DNA helicase
MPIINLEAEQYLLGCILNEGELIKEISLTPEHFYSAQNRSIFETFKQMEKESESIDLTTAIIRLVDESDILTTLSSSIASVEPFKRYEKHILDAWKLRQAELIANKLKGDVESKDTAIISESIQSLSRLDEVGHDEDFNLRGLLIEMSEEFEQDLGALTGIDTGYRDLNTFTNGWQDQDLIIVAARPSVGKTAFALNMADKSASQGVITSIFSLEMGAKSLMKRIISNVARIDASKMRNVKRLCSDEEKRKIITSFGIVDKYPLHIYDNPTVTTQDIRAKVRKLKRKHPDKKHICFIDYLTLIKGSGENRVQEVGEITRQLKVMAREFDMPFIVLAQLSRSVEQRQDKRPMMSDLRDSGEIEQHADIISFLYRDDYYNKGTEEKDVIEIILAKQRNGATGTIKLAFLKEYNKFLDLAYGH